MKISEKGSCGVFDRWTKNFLGIIAGAWMDSYRKSNQKKVKVKVTKTKMKSKSI